MNILLIILGITGVSGYCIFPSLLYGRKHHWRMYGNGGEPFEVDTPSGFHHREMSFDSYFITVYYPDPQRVAYYLTCLQAYNDSVFMLNLLDKDAGSLGFLCAQFEVKSLTVVQLSTSTMENLKSAMSCDRPTTMTSTPAPLIYFNEDKDFWNEESLRYVSYTKCPIEGGFVAQWQNQTGTGSSQCQTKWPLRFESECAQGTGIGFSDVIKSRDNACHLPIAVAGQGYDYCLATWKSANNTFFVTSLKTDTNVIPCFRFPTEHDNDQFDLFIFMDGVCDVTEDFSQSRNVAKVTLKHFDITDVCSDLSPDCITQNASQCQMVGVRDVICRGACKICPDSLPWSSKFFDQKFKGVWIKDTYGGGQERLVIDDKNFMLKSSGHFENFGPAACSQGPTPRASNDMGSNVHEYVLIMRSDNGCAPRVANIQISRRSPSVLSYRISRSKPLQIDSSYLDLDPLSGSLKLQRDFDHWCIQSDYTLYGPPPLSSLYRTYTTGWYNVISAKSPSTLSPCYFTNSTLSLMIHTDMGLFCQATLFPKESTGLQLRVERCWGKNNQTVEIKTEESEVSLSCLSSFWDNQNRKFVITQTSPVVTSLSIWGDRSTICWVYDDVIGVGSWYRASDCDSSVSSDGISEHGPGYRRAIAVFNATEVSSSGTSCHVPYDGTFMLMPAGVLLVYLY